MACVALAAAFSLVAAPPASAKPGAKVAVGRDWSKIVVATPQGGFRMGNPNAKVKLVEYGSLACPHCRHFEETGYKPLVQDYVRPGRVSYEFRNLLLNAPDTAVSLLAHCAGPAKFFAMAEAAYASQPQWFGRIEKISAGQQAELNRMTDQQRIARLGEIAGFPQIAARFGMTPAQSRECVADPKGLQRLLSITKAAEDSGVDHTPTFFINGKVDDAMTWEQLEPRLKASGD